MDMSLRKGDRGCVKEEKTERGDCAARRRSNRLPEHVAKREELIIAGKDVQSGA